jgi:hypothetical protein
MSGRKSISFVDFTWFSFDFDSVCFGLFRLFLVRNWCGDKTFRGFWIVHQIIILGPANYESGGQEFESLRVRHYLATTYRAKIIALLRDLQGSSVRKWTLVTAIRR